MANLNGTERAHYVQEMFAQIARRYDLMNRLMTAGQDVRWRQEVIRRAGLPPNGWLLDLGAGTGDLTCEGLRQHPNCRVVAADFTLEMIQVGRSHDCNLSHSSQQLRWAGADALNLPFSDNFFNSVVSGFLLRNLSDILLGLQEQFRVLKPGGRIVTLDTTPPAPSLLTPMIRFHLQTLIPLLGKIIAGKPEAYQYLPDSTERFLTPEQLSARLLSAGFQRVGFRRLMFGTVAIHWGHKPVER